MAAYIFKIPILRELLKYKANAILGIRPYISIWGFYF